MQLDYDASGSLVGIDIDNASSKVQLKELILSKLPGTALDPAPHADVKVPPS